MQMNILVIGNGFDLAHGLPTKYTDFLDFCERVFPIYENVEGRGVHLYQQEYLFDWNFNKEIKGKLKSAYSSRRKNTIKEDLIQFETIDPKLDEMYALIRDNIWIEYFFQCDMHKKENWIDFEKEISGVIQSLDNDMFQDNYDLGETVSELSNEFLSRYYPKSSLEEQFMPMRFGEEKKSITYGTIRDKLYNDLNRLIRALEIYLAEYVENIACDKMSPDIRDVMTYLFEFGDKSSINKLSKVLNFNYTSIFEQVYKNNVKKFINNVDDMDKDYIDNIHGKADIGHKIEDNNMVLGINEYLPEDRKDRDIDFIAFKKYYQRIYKGTGCKYKKWVDEIKNSYEMCSKAEADYLEMLNHALKKGDKNEVSYWFEEALSNAKEKKKMCNLYIFGHSLDITDKDILRDLILNDNVYTTIYYPNREELGRKIANLVKVIGQDELIRRTGGSIKTIEFKQQQDMIPIEE